MKKYILTAVAMLLLLGTLPVRADAPTYTPTEVQKLQLQVKQLTVIVASKDYAAAQEKVEALKKDVQNAYNDLLTSAEKVKTENKWPSDVKFDASQLTFSPAPTTPVSATEKK